MKRKHGRERSRVEAITDPKKLAWLRAEIEKRKAGGKPRATFKPGATLKRTALNSE